MDAFYVKQYVDACVQTSPNASATRAHHDQSTVKTTPILNCLKRVTYVDETMPGIFLNNSRASRVYPRTPVNRMKTQLPSNHPSQLLGPSVATQSQRRIVSLPEQLGSDILSERLANSLISCSRNVSMPAAIQHFPQVEIDYEDSPSMHMSPSISYDEEEYSHIQRYPHARYLPRTPPLPSTPDSIEIIDSSFHISDAFLRAQRHPINKMKAVHKDWLTWTNSPPRPIPALHGPASLPYARCPSGAEGTVIEEPSTVPGLIWGLRDSGPNVPTEHIQADSGKGTSHFHAIYAHPEHSQTPYQSLEAVDHRETQTGSFDQQQPSFAFDDTSLTQAQVSIDTSKVHDQARGDRHLLRSKQILDEWTNRYERLPSRECELAPQHEDIRSTVHASSVSEKLSNVHPPKDLSDEEVIFDPPTDQDIQSQMSIDSLTQHQSCRISNSLLDAIFREHNQCNVNINLDASAPTFTPSHHRRSLKQFDTNKVQASVEAIYVARTDDNIKRASNRGLRQKCATSHNVLPTPPDSTSPLWSSGPSPLLNDAAVVLQQPHKTDYERPVLEQYGLNLRAPAASLENLSEQLRRLILQQQINYETIISLNQDHDATPHPLEEQVVSVPPPRSRSFTVPDHASVKPSMPINLQDLVARQTPTHTPVVDSPVMFVATHPTTSLTSNGATKQRQTHPAAVNDICPVLSSSKDDYEYRVGRGDVLTGRRHPRSIPLSRLLERKLASVPEETSFVDTNSEMSSLAVHPVPTSTSVRPLKKDYDFTELRSPIVETVGDEPYGSQSELPGPSSECKIVEPAKQKKRQVKIRLPADAPNVRKLTVSRTSENRTSERKSVSNDENTYVPSPSVSTPKKRSGFNQRNTRVDEPAKRGPGPYKARRRD